jgi:hypothetical protein
LSPVYSGIASGSGFAQVCQLWLNWHATIRFHTFITTYSCRSLLLHVGISTISSIKLAEAPYYWIFISLPLTCLLAATTSNTILKALWLNSSAVIAIFLVVESYWTITTGTADTGSTLQKSHDYVSEHDVPGHASIKENTATAVKYYHNKLVYKLDYGIGKQGLCIVPSSNPEASNCIILFRVFYVWRKVIMTRSQQGIG